MVRFEPSSAAAPGGRDVVRVEGLDESTLRALSPLASDEEWARVFPVQVGEAPSPGDEWPTLLGTYAPVDGGVQFEPRFPFERGQTYHASWRSPVDGTEVAAASLELTPDVGEPTTRVTAVFPSDSSLPENLLRFYVHFSAPMSREDALEHVRLVGPDGPVEMPFAAPQLELWNGSRDRLTLILDPGRIKRGVGPNVEHGPVLAVGEAYALEIARTIPDGRGRGLTESFSKRFHVAPADRHPPEPASWELFPPRGRRDEVTLRFEEAVDHALLLSALRVLGPAGDLLAGEVIIGGGERSWSFRPAEEWPLGTCRLVVDSVLEDPSGNRIGRPFELRAEGGTGRTPAEPVVMEFAVATTARG